MWRWEREDGRYYEVVIMRERGEGITVYRLNGGQRRSGSQTRKQGVDDEAQALKLVREIAQRRRRHGYRLVVDDPFVKVCG